MNTKIGRGRRTLHFLVGQSIPWTTCMMFQLYLCAISEVSVPTFVDRTIWITCGILCAQLTEWCRKPNMRI